MGFQNVSSVHWSVQMRLVHSWCQFPLIRDFDRVRSHYTLVYTFVYTACKVSDFYERRNLHQRNTILAHTFCPMCGEGGRREQGDQVCGAQSTGPVAADRPWYRRMLLDRARLTVQPAVCLLDVGVEDHVPKLALVVLVHVGGFLRSDRVLLLLRHSVILSPAAARRRLRWW